MDFNNMNAGMPSFPTMNGEVQTRVEEPSNKGKILIADDTPVMQTILKSALPDFETEAVSNGDEAVEKCKEKEFDGVLLDIMMPGSDGFTLLDYVKNNNVFLPITVISGDDSATTVQRVFDEYKSLAYIDYVNKPINRETVHSKAVRMQQVTHNHRIQNQANNNPQPVYQQPSNVVNFSDYQTEEEQSYQRVA